LPAVDVRRLIRIPRHGRRERAEDLHRRARADAFVAIEHRTRELTLLVLDRHRDDLLGEEPVVGVLLRAPMALDRVRVHVVTRDAVLVGEHLRDPELDTEHAIAFA